MNEEEKNAGSSIMNAGQQDENMEVHHHPQVEKKNFKEYLLEGLMIFIAVTLGFFAEGLRENINDKEKEKEYISSLVSNLEQDTLHLNNTISFNQEKIKGLDSLIALASKNINDQFIRQQLYKFSRYISWYSRFSSNDATMMQLKNSGGLRLIKHAHVADSIANYDMEMRAIYAAESPYGKAIYDALDATQELLIFTWYKDTSYYKNGAFTNKELPLLEDDSKKIKVFFNKISDERGWTQNYVNNLEGRSPFATRFIAYLKKEYGIE